METASIHVSNNIRKNKMSKLREKVNYDEAFRQSTDYFGGDELAAGVWLGKYALKDALGNVYERTPDDMHRRMSAELARIEQRYPNPLSEEDIFDAIKNFKYIVPQGGPMSGIGNDFQVASLSNCFVIGGEHAADSYGALLKIDEEQVQLMKRRGGVGHDLSHIRPKGAPVHNSALTATGVVPFMERYSNSTREVAQDGRRGALMLSISVLHPDAEDFIKAKLDSSKITGANVSVRLTNEFLKAVEANTTFVQQFPVDSVNPIIKKEINARQLWDMIVFNAWKSAEPGLLFWDTIIKESLPDCYNDQGFKTISTNPCGEIPLCAYDSCRLLAMNLYSFVERPFTKEASFDFVKFRYFARVAQRIADDIIDLEIEKIDQILAKIEKDPEPDCVKYTERELWLNIKKMCVKGRRTGTGVTAEGDMLAALGLTYGSEKAIEFCENLHKTLALEVYKSSAILAKERGAFPVFDALKEVHNPFISRLTQADQSLKLLLKKHGRRNIATLTIAPTGTTSMMTQTTSGIEPVFMVSYKRRKKINPTDKNARVDFTDEVGDKWQEFHVFHHKFNDWLRVNGFDIDVVKKLPQNELDKIVGQSPYNKSTAQDVDWLSKVKLQGAVQRWVDHSISVTVNVPNSAGVDLIDQIYMTGWKSGCKGITVYRDGSRSGVLVNDKKQDLAHEFNFSEPPKRPKALQADVMRFNNEDQKWIAVVGLLNNRPYEIFTGKAEDSFSLPHYVAHGVVIKHKENGKSRYDFQYVDNEGYRTTIEGLSRSFNPEYWNYAKLISGVLRHGMPLHYVVHMVNNLHLNDDSLNTWKNGVIRALKKYIGNGTTAVDTVCGDCNQKALVYEEGCLICKNCGKSECS